MTNDYTTTQNTTPPSPPLKSLAIIKFIQSAYPGTMSPSDPVDVGYVEMIAEIINSGIQPLQNFSTGKEITEGSGGTMNGREWGGEKIKIGLDEVRSCVCVCVCVFGPLISA